MSRENLVTSAIKAIRDIVGFATKSDKDLDTEGLQPALATQETAQQNPGAEKPDGQVAPNTETKPEGRSPVTHLTDRDIRDGVQAALAREHEMMVGPDIISAIEGTMVIFRNGERMFRRAFTIDDNNVITLVGETEEVQQDTRFVPVVPAANSGTGGSKPQEEVENVQKSELVNTLIAHSKTAWREEDREFLTGLGEDQLTRLSKEAEARTDNAAAPAVNQSVSDPAPTTQAQPAQAQPQATAQAVTPEQYLPHAPEGFMDLIVNRVEEGQRRRMCIQTLVQNGWDQDELSKLGTQSLEKMAGMLKGGDYSGLGNPAVHGSQGDQAPTPPPVILRKKETVAA